MPGPWRRENLPEDSFKISGFQSQTRCQAPGDPAIRGLLSRAQLHFNLRRDARPLATPIAVCLPCLTAKFQSQTRCQAPGDRVWSGGRLGRLEISISDEMPGPWRLYI